MLEKKLCRNHQHLYSTAVEQHLINPPKQGRRKLVLETSNTCQATQCDLCRPNQRDYGRFLAACSNLYTAL